MHLEKYRILRTGKDYAGVFINLMVPATIGAAISGALTGLSGNKTNTVLMYFEWFIPSLDQREFGIGRIIAAVITFFEMIHGAAPFLLCAVAFIIHVDGFNFWTFTIGTLPKSFSKQDLHRSFIEMKLFNKFTNEAFWLCLIVFLICGVSVQVTINVVMIALVYKLDLVSFIVIAIIWVAFMAGITAIIPIAEKMHMYSEEYIKRVKSDKSKEMRRLSRSMQTLGIQIGSFFVIKSITYLEIMRAVFDHTINILLALEDITRK